MKNTVRSFKKKYHMLNKEIDLQSLFGLHVHSCLYLLAESWDPAPPPPPPFGLIYEGAISQPR